MLQHFLQHGQRDVKPSSMLLNASESFRSVTANSVCVCVCLNACTCLCVFVEVYCTYTHTGTEYEVLRVFSPN